MPGADLAACRFMKQMTTTQKIAQSFGQVQEWLHALDWKDWLRQIIPENGRSGSTPPSEGPPSEGPPSERPSSFEAELPTLRSDPGPTNEDLEKLERGQIPSLFDLEERQTLDELTLATAREEERPFDDDDGIGASPSAIGDELARRMLLSATGNDVA